MENELEDKIEEIIEGEVDHENMLRNEELEVGDNIIENEVSNIIEEQKEKELSELKKQVLAISVKFMTDWGISPGMGFIAGQVRPLVSIERIRQVLEMLEQDGYIIRIQGPKYHRGFRLVQKDIELDLTKTLEELTN